MGEPVVLTTPRLLLTAPTEADIPAVFDACQDPLIQRYTTVPSPYALEHAEGYVARAAESWASGAECR